MSLFSNLVQAVSSGFGNPDSPQAKIAHSVLERFQANDGGGLNEVVQQLESRGLGHIVQSWIGTGANQPISAEQLKSALGSEWIQQLAARVGVSPDVISSHLSEILPKILDRLTPSGEVPQQSATS
ncbi:MAG TPA: YidB family protein [Planctomycetaceae bacterium]|nr:YidB family protein [Planctomycetaceae bacterium]